MVTQGTNSPVGSAGITPGLAKAFRVAHLLGAATCGSILVFVAALQEAPMSAAQLALFYGVPGAALVFFAGAAMAGPLLRINLAIVVASALAALGLAEVVLQCVPMQAAWEGVAADLGSVDRRSKLRVVRDLRGTGVQALPLYSPWLIRDLPGPIDDTDLLPLQTRSRSTTVACQEGHGWLVYDSDEHGFRGNGPWSDSVQVAVLGDSFASGLCVPDGDDMASQLRHTWPSTFNLGVAGAGPLHELAVLREYGPVLKPSVVVWVYYEGNDEADLNDELTSPLLVKYLSPTFRVGVADRQNEVDRYLSQLLDSVYEATEEQAGGLPTSGRPFSAVVKEAVKLTRLRGVLGLDSDFPRAEPLGLLPEVLRLGRDTAHEWGGRVVLVYLPAYSRFGTLLGGSDSNRSAILAAASELGVPMVDLVDVFQVGGDPESMWVHPRGHLNPKGYRVAADAVASAVASLDPAP